MIESEMQAIPIQETMDSSVVATDLFIRLSRDKYVQVAKAGGHTPVDIIKRYQTKGVECLWVRLGDYRRLVEHSFIAADNTLQSKGMSDQVKFAALQDAMTFVYRELTASGVSGELLSRAKVLNHSTVKMVINNLTLTEIVDKMGRARDKNVQHSMMVSVVSSMLGLAQGWTSSLTLEKLALAGFLHDIGMAKLPPEIVVKHASQLNRDERVIFESHPEVGKQILQQSKMISDEVVQAVYEHHELADGSGYPQGLKDLRTSPLARVLSLANVFVDTLEKENLPYQSTAAVRVVADIEFQRAAHFNKVSLKSLRNLVEEDHVKAVG